jgi:hypothetical protein
MLGSLLTPPSITTFIVPLLVEQYELVVLTATVENELGVNKLTESYIVQSPASVTKKEYIPDERPVNVSDVSKVIPT